MWITLRGYAAHSYPQAASDGSGGYVDKPPATRATACALRATALAHIPTALQDFFVKKDESNFDHALNVIKSL